MRHERKLLKAWKRPELFFVLEQSLALNDAYQQKIVECNLRIEAHLKSLESKTHG
jgi:hypothetical protein